MFIEHLFNGKFAQVVTRCLRRVVVYRVQYSPGTDPLSYTAPYRHPLIATLSLTLHHPSPLGQSFEHSYNSHWPVRLYLITAVGRMDRPPVPRPIRWAPSRRPGGLGQLGGLSYPCLGQILPRRHAPTRFYRTCPCLHPPHTRLNTLPYLASHHISSDCWRGG